jgi:hypothetical protein
MPYHHKFLVKFDLQVIFSQSHFSSIWWANFFVEPAFSQTPWLAPIRLGQGVQDMGCNPAMPVLQLYYISVLLAVKLCSGHSSKICPDCRPRPALPGPASPSMRCTVHECSVSARKATGTEGMHTCSHRMVPCCLAAGLAHTEARVHNRQSCHDLVAGETAALTLSAASQSVSPEHMA